MEIPCICTRGEVPQLGLMAYNKNLHSQESPKGDKMDMVQMVEGARKAPNGGSMPRRWMLEDRKFKVE